MNNFKLDSDQLQKWARNLLIFTAPILAIFFAQLASGVDLKPALLVASYALYAILADYFKKLNQK